MFVLRCKEDNKICLVKDGAVICDMDSVGEGDTVPFLYNEKIYSGVVLFLSDDEELMNREYTNLTQEKLPSNDGTRSKKDCSRGSKISVDNLREGQKPQPKKGSAKSVDDANRMRIELSRKKQKPIVQDFEDIVMDANLFEMVDTQGPSKSAALKRLSNYNLREKSGGSSKKSKLNVGDEVQAPSSPPPSEDDISPPTSPQLSSGEEMSESDDEISRSRRHSRFPREIRGHTSTRKRNRAVASSGASKKVQQARNDYSEYDGSTDDDDDDTNNNQPIQAQEHDHLFGPNYPAVEMEHLQDGLFCKAPIKAYAVDGSQNARRCARKLMVGVFHLKAIFNCNRVLSKPRGYSKQKHRSHNGNGAPSGNQQSQIQPKEKGILYGPAIRAIIDFARQQAKKMEGSWPKVSRPSIQEGLTQKITEIRIGYKRAIQLGQEFEYGGEWFSGNDERIK
ncbi:hypothetical protein QAD02_003582 [Eretmocerus hayati]|uniref:Uncharacterized protein n=1 Tax=Eretmocerus hayati TaxID=131215 RepID=A0ACC2NM84_9HYME|nr:hypothetical protein QAD02_003582 [Eretmocerus hayati]